MTGENEVYGVAVDTDLAREEHLCGASFAGSVSEGAFQIMATSVYCVGGRLSRRRIAVIPGCERFSQTTPDRCGIQEASEFASSEFSPSLAI